MRQGVVQAAVDNFGWRLRRGDSIVRMDSLWGIKFGVLDTLNYAVDALMSILLRWSVLLMLLQIGAAAHVRAEARTVSFRRSISLGHGELLWRLSREVWRRLLSRFGSGGVGSASKVRAPRFLPSGQG